MADSTETDTEGSPDGENCFPGPLDALAPPAIKRPWWKRKVLLFPAALVAVFSLVGVFGELNTDDDRAAPTSTELLPGSSIRTDGSPPIATVQVATVPTAPAPITPAITTAASATRAAATTTPPGTPAAAIHVIAELETLTVAEPDPDRSPYIRDEYRPDGWGDVDGDCVSTRHETLIADSQVEVTMTDGGCQVATGKWVDAYTGDVMTSAKDATIDHVIPLAEAHRAGGWKWDNETKVAFANDESAGALVVVTAATNQAKADHTPDKWLPAGPAQCGYAMNWVNQKHRWGLTVTAAERDTLLRILNECVPDTTPDLPPSPLAAVVITEPTTTTPTTIVQTSGPPVLVLASCDRYSEEVVISNQGGEPADLNGYTLHDEGIKHATPLGQWGPLAPGTSLTIVTGDEATDGPNQVVWKRKNVWNNDGDIAYLVGPDGEQTVRC